MTDYSKMPLKALRTEIVNLSKFQGPSYSRPENQKRMNEIAAIRAEIARRGKREKRSKNTSQTIAYLSRTQAR